MQKVCIVGLGVIGQALLKNLKGSEYFDITGVDIDEEKRKIVEEKYNIETSELPVPADTFIVVVQTPINSENMPDLSFFWEAVKGVKKVLKTGDLVVINSTIPPGTMRKVEQLLNDRFFKSGEDFFLSYCPERILPGLNMIKEFRENSRIISGDTPSCMKANTFYRNITESKQYFTSFENAELIKLAENSFRDVNIAYANELSKIVSSCGGDIGEVIKLANLHPRVNILSPGLGVGGHCIAVDPFLLIANTDYKRLISHSRIVNDSMPRYFFEKFRELLPEAKEVCIFGTSYKPDVNDLRESPAVELINIFKENNYSLRIYEPYNDIEVNIEQFCYEVDCIIIACDHSFFKMFPVAFLKNLKNSMKKAVIVTPFLSDYSNWQKAGFEVINIFGSKEGIEV